MSRSSLPVRELEGALAEAFRETNRLVLEAPTGSGKSTQVPQILVEQGLCRNGEVVVLQPRRLAARMLAARVARERGGPLGDEVGYHIRFDRKVSARTRIRFVTEGILLRQIMDEPELPGVAAILFDEFHERHLYGDITLARALQVQETRRPDLKLAVMSATLDRTALETYLQPCRTLRSEGRAFPVETAFLPRSAQPHRHRPWDLAARELDRLVREGAEGDALVFMPGAYEIQRTIRAIEGCPALRSFAVFPLYGDLSPQAQDDALAPCDRRKIVVATNVAETSLTIEGIRIVVDSGLARTARFDPHRGINTLLVEKISRASADQRTGRAGRTAPGRCLRLWTEDDHLQRPPAELPEIKRLDLAEILLTLKNSGIDDLARFPWVEPPDPVALERAERLLGELGALETDSGRISGTGRQMAAYPVHPRYSRMLIAARKYGCVPEVALIAALTQTRDLLERRPGERVEARREDRLGDESESDFFAQMRAWNHAAQSGFSARECREVGIHAGAARQATRIYRHFLGIARRDESDTQSDRASSETVRRCLLLGFSDQVAKRAARGTTQYEMVHGRRGALSRDSVVRDAPLLVACEVREVQTAGRGSEVAVRIGLASAIEETWLEELFPADCRTERGVRYDPSIRRVIGEESRIFRDLVLWSKPVEDPPPEAAARLLAEEVAAGRCPLKNWDHAVEQWIARLNCLAEWMPELEIPPVRPEDRKALIEQIVYGARGYKEIKDRPVLPTVKAWLSPEQDGLLDHYAPPGIELPRGRKVKLVYTEKEPPVLSARVQDLYDLHQNPRVADGRIGVLIHVLAPNQRPVQVTADIGTFWKNSYPEIKKQLQGRYPKHEWR